MVSKRVSAIICSLILAVVIVGLAWTQWPFRSSDGSIEERHNQSIYEHLNPAFAKEHQKERLIIAARENPGFGGLFLSNRQTVLNIYIAEDKGDPERWEKDRQVLEELLDPQSGLKLNVIKGNYTITQLSAWYKLMESEGIWEQDGVIATDLQEATNKLYIAVVSEWDVESVRTFLEEIGIPREATTVAVEEPMTH